MEHRILYDLYKRQAKIIYLYLIKRGCQKEEAEDIVQDSFIKAIEYMDGVAVDKLSSWLFKVALNNYYNRIKKNRIYSKSSIDDVGMYMDISSDINIEKNLLSKEKSNDIKLCLNSLKEKSKSLLILKYDMELSYREILILLGIKEDTIKTYLYRARNEFKKVWRDKYEK
ncbi:DNA-directed RNA polymerase sigma-70 factor [Clostridium tetani]|uniref:RNA polymerase sigma factor n=1 Tax=Clostridium tetani TaxID=1513 RepID=A0ABC8EA60_CLOTA|nr:RNA polymerase sigma factor [Clostridium tetani]BDR80473.1 DNA-directed RNA polymerase sigma-70 factor [Clostridium tetani]BDR88928.1 DNA-directed RNA polymerase sigma-70 factor [Clostridium tetani]